MKALTAKLLNDKLKNGWTPNDFADHLGISIDQFWDLLKKEFTRNAYEGFRSSLNRNEKYRKRATKKAVKTLVETCEEHSTDIPQEPASEIPEASLKKTTEEIPADPIDEIPTDTNIESEVEITSELESAEKNSPSIAELETQLRQSTDTLIELEGKHKECGSKRHQINTEISAHKKAFEKMLAEVLSRKQAIKELTEQFDSIGETMWEITSQIRDAKQRIEDITTKLEQAKKVLIYACDSGEVVIESKLKFEIENWKPLYYTIIEENELNSLTIIQAQALAQTITLVHFLIAQKIPYEVVFDNKISEAYFKKVIS